MPHGTIFWREAKKIWPLLLALAAFYFLPYSSIDPGLRAEEKFFSMYHRFAGFLSGWEVLLIIAGGTLLVHALLAGNVQLTLGKLDSAPALFLLFAIALALGLLHVDGSLLSYGTTEIKRSVIAFLPIFYLVVMYLLVMNFLPNEIAAQALLRALTILTTLLATYGLIRLALILQGRLVTMWPFGLPIVLYDQMVMLYPLIFTIAALALFNISNRDARRRWYHGLLWSVLVTFILISARRYNYLLLAAGLLLTVVAALALQQWRMKKILLAAMKATVIFMVVLFALRWIAPQAVRGVTQSLATLELGSRLSNRYGGDIRRAELANMFANMERRPYSYLVGMGLGTKWQTLVEQPLDNFTYPKAYVATSRGWFPQFHLPYVAGLYRFGMLGFAGLLAWMIFYWHRRWQKLKSLATPQLRAHALAMMIFLLLILPNLGDSANPTVAILSGVCMGILDRLLE